MKTQSPPPLLTLAGLALASACSTPTTGADVKAIALPANAVARIDTTTPRALPYTLREDDLADVVDTDFVATFGSGRVGLPLDAFYGPTVLGQVGSWPVDGRGRVAATPGQSIPGFVSRLEAVPDGPIQLGQTWEVVTPTDSAAMASASITMQIKRRFTVAQAFSTPTGAAVRVTIEGWSRVVDNPAMVAFATESGMTNPQPTWAPRLLGTADVELASGTVLGLKFHEELFSAAATPAALTAAASTTYCIDTSTGFTPRADICGWSL